MIDIEKIKTLLPHRYPFLLVDRVEELEEHKYIKAYKNRKWCKNKPNDLHN